MIASRFCQYFKFLVPVLIGLMVVVVSSGMAAPPVSSLFDSSAQPAHAKLSVATDKKFIPQSGDELWVGVTYEIAPGWHTYAPFPGAAYMPPSFKLDPKFGRVKQVVYPIGQPYMAFGKRFPVYFDTVRILVKVKLAEGQNPDSDVIPMTVDWLACTESLCVPQSAVIGIPVRYGKSAPSIYYRDIHQQLNETRVPEMPESRQMSWVSAILLAFFGGLILNLMPCVFPVLSLKVFQVLKSSTASQSNIKSELGFYTIGVITTLWILAALTITLRALGHWAGWGFQLQSPVFVLFLSLVFIVFGILMLDWVKIPANVLERFYTILGRLGLGRVQESGKLGSYFTGMLAVAAATPCTAPFMGAAITYALSQSALVVVVIFTSLGLGLAAPFGLLAIFPHWFSKLPKPGPWMLVAKRVLAIPLFITAIWLFIVAIHQFNPVTKSGTVAEITQLVAQHQAVLVDVSADWCITCKVNEKVLNSDRVQAAFRKNHVQLRVLDWTKADPSITQYLKSNHRSGVPAYFYYNGRSPTPKSLPQILTPAMVIQAIDR